MRQKKTLPETKSAPGKDVLITIRSTQQLAGSYDGIELVTEGKYTVEKDGIHFSYMESELTGLEGTKTDFFVKPEEVVMSRQGAVTSQMIFHKGRKQHFAYETPIGTLTMGLNTHRINSALGENGGEMEIVYDLNFDTALFSRNQFKINVRAKN